MGENEFELNGVVYVAVDEIDCCYGCEIGAIGECANKQVPACGFFRRIDIRSVIFVEKQQ